MWYLKTVYSTAAWALARALLYLYVRLAHPELVALEVAAPGASFQAAAAAAAVPAVLAAVLQTPARGLRPERALPLPGEALPRPPMHLPALRQMNLQTRSCGRNTRPGSRCGRHRLPH